MSGGIKFEVKSSFKENPKFRKRLEGLMSQALEQVGDQVIGDLRLSQTMPKDSGHLQNASTSAHLTDKGLEISSHTPYARRLYFHPEYNFRTDKNPFAGARWFDPYLTGHSKGDFIPNAFSAFLGRLL